ncbi:hypothetical protein A2Z61_01565 [Candidatus Campbellbacteria bacterium RIFCSPLOWO2_02_35_12]|uniref:Uncharacterized protein n=1 Tax=Candidatus Campbellbacteria bacterium RIFCSPLOWO2_02_35_12 TaxID=1797580 RepID=A0A1F5EJ37_9BACT|nr:MAG: hypothetical protein A2Z61_01565 [Candidatus Campbellbacteria bacterium RIFCSPLOWO2_02_35_12]
MPNLTGVVNEKIFCIPVSREFFKKVTQEAIRNALPTRGKDDFINKLFGEIVNKINPDETTIKVALETIKHKKE